MENKPVAIKIYTDLKDTASITSAINQMELKKINVEYSFPKAFDIKEDEIIIIQIKNNESKLIDRILSKKNGLENKVIFVIRDSNALLISTLAKFGFNQIFIFPFEIYKFISHLNDIILNKAYRTSRKSGALINQDNFKSLIGKSKEFTKIIDLAKKVSENSTSSVLILGETGTGKGLLARAIHNNSKFGNSPFVDIVCSAIPENLLESELFGYEKGAFTNAHVKKLGLFELAENGTLFLDEVGDLSLNLQVKLLRVIEKKVIRRLGGVKDIPVNARIISATNKDLEQMLEMNLFRRDLYHRLNVISLEIPPLRNRTEDILLLANHFVKEFNHQFNKNVKIIDMDKELKNFMLNYHWPGNVREIRNAVERAVLLSEDQKLLMKDFTTLLNNVSLNSAEVKDNLKNLPQYLRLDLNYSSVDLRSLEKLYAKEVLNKMEGNKSKTAKVLGISRPKLDSLLKENLQF